MHTADLVNLKLAGANQRHHSQLREAVRRVQALRREFAAEIIAEGVLSDNDHWTEILAVLAEAEGDTHYANILAGFCREADAAGVDRRLRNTVDEPIGDGGDRIDDVMDVIFNRAMLWGDLGFLLGLAVGTQLGPSAFAEGGSR